MWRMISSEEALTPGNRLGRMGITSRAPAELRNDNQEKARQSACILEYWGDEPVRYLMLEGGYERVCESGEVMRGPGHVPCAIQEEPNPGPGSDVKVGCGTTVGEDVVSELERALMKRWRAREAATLAARAVAEAEGSEPAAA